MEGIILKIARLLFSIVIFFPNALAVGLPDSWLLRATVVKAICLRQEALDLMERPPHIEDGLVEYLQEAPQPE